MLNSIPTVRRPASAQVQSLDTKESQVQTTEDAAAATRIDATSPEEATIEPKPVSTATTNAPAIEQANEATVEPIQDTTASDDAPASQAAKADPAVDLSGELYSKDAASQSTSAAAPNADVPKKKKRGFRAAWGAIRELLK